MDRQESPQLIDRKTQVDADAQETTGASKYQFAEKRILYNLSRNKSDSICGYPKWIN